MIKTRPAKTHKEPREELCPQCVKTLQRQTEQEGAAGQRKRALTHRPTESKEPMPRPPLPDSREFLGLDLQDRINKVFDFGEPPSASQGRMNPAESVTQRRARRTEPARPQASSGGVIQRVRTKQPAKKLSAKEQQKRSFNFAHNKNKIGKKYRINATTYPRVFLAGTDKISRINLIKRLGLKTQPPKGVDLSYRQHVDLIDSELDDFLPKEGYDPNVHRPQYNQIMASSSIKPTSKKPNMFYVEDDGPLMLSAMTPFMLDRYGDMHYKHELKKQDETQSTRTYESQYVDTAFKSMPFETFRAFFLPMGSNVEKDQETMINAYGASLDANVPTRGNTLGAGKINSMVFLHFRKTLEILNQDLDKGALKDTKPGKDDFEKRTQKHIELLRSYGLKGMMVNEKQNLEQSKEKNLEWDDLEKLINESKDFILQNMQKLNEDESLPEIKLDLKDANLPERLRLLGVILGLMIKTEKRMLMDHYILGTGTEETGTQILTNLKNMGLVEKNINEALEKYKGQL